MTTGHQTCRLPRPDPDPPCDTDSGLNQVPGEVARTVCPSPDRCGQSPTVSVSERSPGRERLAGCFVLSDLIVGDGFLIRGCYRPTTARSVRQARSIDSMPDLSEPYNEEWTVRRVDMLDPGGCHLPLATPLSQD